MSPRSKQVVRAGWHAHAHVSASAAAAAAQRSCARVRRLGPLTGAVCLSPPRSRCRGPDRTTPGSRETGGGLGSAAGSCRGLRGYSTTVRALHRLLARRRAVWSGPPCTGAHGSSPALVPPIPQPRLWRWRGTTARPARRFMPRRSSAASRVTGSMEGRRGDDRCIVVVALGVCLSSLPPMSSAHAATWCEDPACSTHQKGAVTAEDSSLRVRAFLRPLTAAEG